RIEMPDRSNEESAVSSVESALQRRRRSEPSVLPCVEKLDQRQLLSVSFDFGTGKVDVSASTGADTIIVQQDQQFANQTDFIVFTNGQVMDSVPIVTSVILEVDINCDGDTTPASIGGNDSVEIDVAISGVAFGTNCGAGDDTVVGSPGEDVMFG